MMKGKFFNAIFLLQQRMDMYDKNLEDHQRKISFLKNDLEREEKEHNKLLEARAKLQREMAELKEMK